MHVVVSILGIICLHLIRFVEPLRQVGPFCYWFWSHLWKLPKVYVYNETSHINNAILHYNHGW